MNKTKLLLVSLIILTLLYSLVPATSATENDSTVPLEVDSNGMHSVRIEASQWELVAFDMVKYNRIFEQDGEKEARLQSEYRHRIGSFIRGANVTLEVVTSDVQHGFSLNELDIQVATNRPGVGESFGKPTVVQFQAPDKDITYSAFCHIFCGLGHPDMKMKFVIGAGSPDFGQEVYWGFIALNTAILGYALYVFWTKITDKAE